MDTALDRLNAEFIHIEALCAFLGISKKRCLDLISLHKTDGQFMPSCKASAGNYYFRYADVRTYLNSRVSLSETNEKKEETD
jgi:hypothetical protein